MTDPATPEETPSYRNTRRGLTMTPEETVKRYRDEWPKPMFFCTGCDEQTDSDPCDRGHPECSNGRVLQWKVVPASLLSKALEAADMPCSSPIRAEILSEIRSDLGEEGEGNG